MDILKIRQIDSFNQSLISKYWGSHWHMHPSAPLNHFVYVALSWMMQASDLRPGTWSKPSYAFFRLHSFWHQQAMSLETTVAHSIVSIFGIILCKPWRWLWFYENARRSAAVCEIIRPAAPTNHFHQVQSPFSLLFFPLILTLALNLGGQHVLMPRYTKLLPCDWQITYARKQLNTLRPKEASESMWNLHESRSGHWEGKRKRGEECFIC